MKKDIVGILSKREIADLEEALGMRDQQFIEQITKLRNENQSLRTENKRLRACVRAARAIEQNPNWKPEQKLAKVIRELALVSGREGT